MAGVLSFTLGLETSNFLRGLGLASGQIISFSAAVDAASKVMAGMWAAIERGGALQDLSARTGESVGNLYRLQEAFTIAGVGAETVSPMLLRLQKALGGVDENGNKTDAVFARLGLSAKQLSSLQAPEQIQAIASSLAKLDRNEAADIASRLFGRDGAGNILQISGDLESFNQTMRETARTSAVFAKNAALFDQIGDTLQAIKREVGGVYAGLAALAGPKIQAALDFVKSWLQSLSGGNNVGELLSLSLQVAFEKGTYYGEQFAVSVAVALTEAIPAAMRAAWQMGLASLQDVNLAMAERRLEAAEKSYEQAINPTGGERGIYSKGRIDSARRELDRAREGFDAVYAGSAAGDQAKVEAAKEIVSAVTKGVRTFAFNWQSSSAPETEASRKLSERMKASTPASAIPGIWDVAKMYALENWPKTPPDDRNPQAPRSDLSDWEKAGFVFRGGGPAQDYNRSTAENTRQMLAEQRKLNTHLAKQNPAASFARK
jgi:tetratricopeptide (TPR) repeat protein